MANIGFISLGCAKNQVDCERMMYRVQEAGHTVCPGVAGCDVVVINTCGFIDSAKTEAIDFILQMGQLKQQGLVGKVLVTGCLSQRYQKQILEELPEADGVLGTGSYHKIVEAIDAVFSDINDLEGLKEDTALTRTLGFDGKTCVHPRQIDVVNSFFTPSKKEIKYALRVLQAVEEGKQQKKGAVTLDGSMIDKPMELRARTTLAQAEAAGIQIGGDYL